MKRIAAILPIALVLFSAAAFAQTEPRVTRFSPQGPAKKIRQVQAVFSAPMVPFGDPRAVSQPFSIECSEPGRGRWVDPRHFVYDFERDLPGGVRCSFQLKPAVKTLSGVKLAGPKRFSFSTGGPAILSSTPYNGHDSISEDQVFVLRLDAEAREDSVLRHAGFAAAGVPERLGVRILKGEEREAILRGNEWMLQGEKDPGRIMLLQCRQRFPVKARVSLIWGKGVQSAGGVGSEHDQVLEFTTRDSFFAAFHCGRENPRAACIPVEPMRLGFNAPLSPGQTGEAVLRGPGGSEQRVALDENAGQVFFEGPFPENAEFVLEIPREITDDAGRPLVNADRFPLKIRTAAYPPLAKFSARFGILELKADPTLPVTLRNLEAEVKARMLALGPPERGLFSLIKGRLFNIPPERVADVQPWLRKVAQAVREKPILADEQAAREFAVPKPGGPAAFEVLGIPLKKPGLYVVELESAILGHALLDPPRPMYVPAAVLVTNLAVHFKRGRESSLAWVTTLDRGEPVGKAAVTVMDCTGRVLWKGRTDASGCARIEAELAEAENGCRPAAEGGEDFSEGALGDLDGGLFITAQTGEDMSFVHSNWTQGIEAWRFKLPTESAAGPVIAHSIFDRSLLRAGETLHMKHVLRRHTRDGFELPPAQELPERVTIRHDGSRQSYEIPLTWDAAGIAETEWRIPKEAKLGSYGVFLIRAPAPGKAPAGSGADEARGEDMAEEGPAGPWFAGRFRVEEFRVPLMKGSIRAPAEPLVNAREAALDLSAQYLAGGGAAELSVTLRTRVGPKAVPPFAGFEDFAFANGGVKEGLVRREQAAEEEGGEAAPGEASRHGRQDIVLGPTGTGRALIGDIPADDRPREILAEMEFRDPNGEIQTVSTRVPVWNAQRLVGLKPDHWAVSREALRFQAAVVDLAGRPVADVSVKLELFKRRVISHRKRLVGGFYAYDHTVAIERAGTLGEGRTDSRGRLACSYPSPLSGELILQAEITDDAGNPSRVHQTVWVAGKDEWWFEAADDDRIDLLPERKHYEPGETAVFQVRMPFREATALVAVEREGVMETWVRKLSGRAPAIEVPVKGSYAPNVFVSVLAVRGRSGEAQPTALADLGKPAFKLGIAEINVGWRAHELKVTVATDKTVYRVRAPVRVSVKAAAAGGGAPPPGSEVALAAVDEGLLELMANKSWDLLAAMMGRRALEVQTATAQMHVVGKRHFGIKALPPGGGGGRQMTRELFDTLLVWIGRLPLDPRGEAEAVFTLNDTLGAFRIVAVATGGSSLFGTGEAAIRSSQDLMLFSGLPPVVREGDRFQAAAGLRNASARSLTVEAVLRVEGVSLPQTPQTAVLAPGESRELAWEVLAPAGRGELAWELEARAEETDDRDRMKGVLKIVPDVPVRVVQATLARPDPGFKLPIEQPAGALAGGGVRVTARPRLGDSLEAVADHMRRYAYGCLEQRVSKAVALRDAALWQEVMARLPAHLDAEGLAKFFPSTPHGDAMLTAYLIATAHEAGYRIPDENRKSMIQALKAFLDGRIVGQGGLAADLTVRKLAAMEALARLGEADRRWINAVAIEPALWPTSAVVDWVNILLSVDSIDKRPERLAEAAQILHSRLDFEGTVMMFSTEARDHLWWLMTSGDLNAVRLILTAMRIPGWREEVPRLVKGALARRKAGHWDITPANAWGMLAMERFSKIFEGEAVTGLTQTELAGRTHRTDWALKPDGDSLLLPWPEKRAGFTARHRGAGKPWLAVESLAAVPAKEPFSAGYRITRTLVPIERRRPDRWSRGDTLRVRLELEAAADMTWVAVEDPVPGGGAILGSGLGRDSLILTRGENRAGNAWPAYEERSFEAFRAYYEFVPKGTWRLEYTLRLNQSGSFGLPPTRVEALYAPEMHGVLPNQRMEISP
jgi:uncharacterized protein YfaS (alpha-2-macroglobulin family)